MFRFTTRELVLLTLVVAMGVGWWIDRRRLMGSVQVISSTADKWETKANSAIRVVNELGVEIRWEADGRTVQSLRMPSHETRK